MAMPAELEANIRESTIKGAGGSSPEQKATRSHIVGAVTIITLGVAILGYFREAILAARFGVTATMDAYFGALFIPINIYLILVVGTVSPILIPILLHDEGNDQARTSENFSVITTSGLISFAFVVICGMATARAWMGWLFPGFDPPTRFVALKLVYIIFPTVPLLALAGVLTAALNGFHKYLLAAFAPALSSVAVIVTALLAKGKNAIYIVGVGTAIGFLLQFLVLVPAIRALGIRYRFMLRFKHPAVLRLFQLGTPLLLYLFIANVSLVVERNLASRLSAGALSSLTYAMRLFSVPSNFFAAPLAIVAYPYFAREAVRENHGNLRHELGRTVRYAIFLFVPITVWLALNGLLVTRALYERGQFGFTDSVLVTRVFEFYVIGILPNAITIPLLRCFYAVEDTLTPLWAESIDLVFFIVFAPLFTRKFGISGLAFTRGMSFVVVAAILLYVLRRKKALLHIDGDTVLFIVRTMFATAAMALASWVGLQLLQSWFDHGGTLARIGLICVQIGLSGAAFLMTAFLLKMQEANRLICTGLSLLGFGAEISPGNA